MTTAAAVIIGDEILTGKVRDTNSVALIDMLRAVGVELRRVLVVADDPAEIGWAVRDCAERFDHVFTSGGVGPTHDDRTVEAIARTFGCRVIRHPELVALIESYFVDQANPAALKMAEVPEGTALIAGGPYPIIHFRNIYILPGIPQLFVAKAKVICARLSGTPRVVQRLFLDAPESEIAAALAQAQDELAPVQIGSYPRVDAEDHRVMVTIEAVDAELVDRTRRRLLQLLPAAAVVRVETGK